MCPEQAKSASHVHTTPSTRRIPKVFASLDALCPIIQLPSGILYRKGFLYFSIERLKPHHGSLMGLSTVRDKTTRDSMGIRESAGMNSFRNSPSMQCEIHCAPPRLAALKRTKVAITTISLWSQVTRIGHKAFGKDLDISQDIMLSLTSYP